MHEFGMVDEFIHLLVAKWKNIDARPAPLFRILYGPGLVEDSLRQAFEVHTIGTSLEGARFEFRKKRVAIPCQCGSLLREGTEEEGIPYAVCPDCQHVVAIPGYNVLELVDGD